MHTSKATSSDDKVASILAERELLVLDHCSILLLLFPEVVESVICSLVEVVTVQRPDLNSRNLLNAISILILSAVLVDE